MCEIIEHQSEFLAISRLDPADSVCAHARGGTLNSQNSQEKQVSHSMEDIHLPADLATVQAQSVLNAFLLRFERPLSRSLAYVSLFKSSVNPHNPAKLCWTLLLRSGWGGEGV